MNDGNRQVVIHIGMPKTGTTSIQNTLKDFRDEKFHYASIRGQSNHSYSLWSLFSQVKNPENHFHHVKRGRNAQEVKAFITAAREDLELTFEAAKDRSIIFSGEGIPTMSKEALVRLRDFLLTYCNTIQIIAYVRSPISFIQSSFQQRLKGEKGSLSLVDFYPNYRDRFEKFEQVFGPRVCHYRKFDPQSFRGRDVVFDFCDHLGISLEGVPVKRENDSLSLDAIKLLYAFRLYLPADCESMGIARVNDRLVKAMKNIGGGKLALGSKFMEPLIAANQEDIKWMEKRLGQSLGEDLASSGDLINSESELLNIDSQCVDMLKDLIRHKKMTAPISGFSPQEAAQLVHMLRAKLSDRLSAASQSGEIYSDAKNKVEDSLLTANMRPLSIPMILNELKSTGASPLNEVTDQQAQSIIKETFRLLADKVGNLNEGVIKIEHLGNFNSRTPPPNSRLAKKGLRRIVFHPLHTKGMSD